MIFDLLAFTLIHVVLSIIGIIAGLVVTGGLMAGVRMRGWTGVFFVTTVLANVTGFGFPFATVLPSHIVGALSLLILAASVVAWYGKRLSGGWRFIFVVTAVAALYLNVFVLFAQLFAKVPAMIAIAPTQQSPAFVVTNLLVLALFIVLGRAAVKGFRAERNAGR